MSLDVKILKSSCCTTGDSITEKLNDASENADVDIRLEILSDLQQTMKYGVMNFPSIVIEGKVYNYNKLNNSQDLERILKEHSNQ